MASGQKPEVGASDITQQQWERILWSMPLFAMNLLTSALRAFCLAKDVQKLAGRFVLVVLRLKSSSNPSFRVPVFPKVTRQVFRLHRTPSPSIRQIDASGCG